jgi:SAM-dependent methyltransferase
MSRSIQHTPWYDLPQFYELSVADETPGEVQLVQQAIQRYATGRVRTILEPACGTGRLAIALAKDKFRVTASDLNPTMLSYARQQAELAQVRVSWQQADMTQIKLSTPVDLAVCLLDSFRHLLSEDAALQHLQSMATAVRPGGLYLLGLHLLPLDASLECTERWTNQSGRTRVTTTLRVLNASRRTRLERIRISLLIRQGQTIRRVRDEFDLRLYTAKQLRELLAKVPAWELAAVTDYWHDLDQLYPLDDSMSDTVLVLKRR